MRAARRAVCRTRTVRHAQFTACAQVRTISTQLHCRIPNHRWRAGSLRCRHCRWRPRRRCDGLQVMNARAAVNAKERMQNTEGRTHACTHADACARTLARRIANDPKLSALRCAIVDPKPPPPLPDPLPDKPFLRCTPSINMLQCQHHCGRQHCLYPIIGCPTLATAAAAAAVWARCCLGCTSARFWLHCRNVALSSASQALLDECGMHTHTPVRTHSHA